MMMPWLKFALPLIATLLLCAQTASAKLCWPLDNRYFVDNKSPESYIQPTQDGKLHSGYFGNVRENGRRFHEGVDLKSIHRDSPNSKPRDRILSILPGKVVHVNRVPSRSSYGNYIVIEHDEESLPVYSLYAHLNEISKNIRLGARVESGAYLGTVGTTAGGYTIPLSRAHLHLEIGLRLSDDFQSWYDGAKYKNKNYHGIWNGMNLVGFDPIDFYRAYLSSGFSSIANYVSRLPAAVEVIVPSSKTPDFIERYDSLMTQLMPRGRLKGWKIEFTWHGLPVRWTPLFDGVNGSKPYITKYHNANLKEGSGRKMMIMKGGKPTITGQLKQCIDILFE